uniref:Protein kinase domain-containing protein n=1 Tax=Parascaris equorum TaxID=6256 RepID=A0A914RE68_PAREQ
MNKLYFINVRGGNDASLLDGVMLDKSWYNPTYFSSSDDPSYFTFFFDTSRRMSCYLAPERLQPSQELNLYAKLPGEFLDVSKDLTHAMDVFSLGCILVELFTDGQCPFSHEQLIKFKATTERNASHGRANAEQESGKETSSFSIGSSIGSSKFHIDENISRGHQRRLNTMINGNGLQKYAPSLFPPIFEHFLYNYMNAFRPKCLQPSVSVEEPSQSFISMDSDDVVAK